MDLLERDNGLPQGTEELVEEKALSPEEEAIYRRGRNANSTRSPRHTDPAVYRCATGMEALFGWLYLTGQVARLEQLFQVILAGQEGTP